MTELLTPHPRRDELNDEVHARPPAPIQAPARLSSLTLFFDRNNSGQLEAIIRLAGRGLRAVSETSGNTLSTLHDRLQRSVKECHADIRKFEEHERQRAEAMAKEEADAA